MGGKPAAVGAITLTAGNADDTFSWSAPQNNGVPITKYAYQVSSDNGSTWYSSIGGTLNGETETSNLSIILNTQYSLSSYKIRVRAFNAVGWGDYSSASSSATVAWTSNTGTDSQSQTDTNCGPAGCSETETENCNCGNRSRTRTRTSSRSRTRTRSTQFYSRNESGSTPSSITYGSWSISDAEWNLGASSTVGWGSYSYTIYPEWSTITWGNCTGTESRVATDGVYNGVSYYTFYDADFNQWMIQSGGADAGNPGPGCGYCTQYAFSIYYCSISNSYRIVGEGCKPVGGPKC